MHVNPDGTVTYDRDDQITISTSAPFFDDTMVGRQVWQKYDANGNGGGRIEIISFQSNLSVVARVLVPVTLADGVSIDNWYLTDDVITGLGYLEGETVQVIADGGNHKDCQVTNGQIQLDGQHGKVWVGYKYRGIVTTLNIDSGGIGGSAQAKARLVVKAMIRFLNTLGTKIGTTLYNLEDLVMRKLEDKGDRPPPLYSGNFRQVISDNTDMLDKHVSIIQDEPLPCTITSIDVHMVTSEGK